MAKSADRSEAALRRFLQRVWREDVAPLLRDRHARQRAKTAKLGGKAAAAGGLLVDSLLRLKGRPFTRAMTVLGASFGAMLPDVWTWRWLRRRADERQRRVVRERVQQRAATLDEVEALALFGLTPAASFEDLKRAWRITARRWHPDAAADAAARAEHQVRFIAYQSAYERLEAAYAAGRLPRTPK